MELIQARERRRASKQRRARILISAAAAAVIVAGTIVGVAAIGDDPADAGVVEIEHVGDLLRITLPNGSEEANDVVAELSNAGVRVRTQPVATGPSRHGLVVGMTVDATATRVANRPGAGLEIEVPASATITVNVGRDTTDGEYVAFTDALAPLEPLHCLAWPGQDAPALVAAVDQLDLQVSFRNRDDDRTLDNADLAGFVVVDATALSSSNIVVYVEQAPSVPSPPCQ